MIGYLYLLGLIPSYLLIFTYLGNLSGEDFPYLIKIPLCFFLSWCWPVVVVLLMSVLLGKAGNKYCSIVIGKIEELFKRVE